jgi:hypothetical protein
MVQLIWEMAQRFIKRLNVEPLYDTAILLLAFILPSPNEIKTSVFIVAIFTITKILKTLKCSLTDDWVKCSV